MSDCVWHITRALLPDGWASDVRISVAGGRIAEVASGEPRRKGDLAFRLALPGLPNLHSHAFQRAMSGLTERRGPHADSFWTWRDLMYRFVERLTPELVEAIASFAFMEMLEVGFTRVGEFHYLHNDTDGARYAEPAQMSSRMAAAAAETGLALTLLPVFYAHSNFGGQPPNASQRRFLSTPDSYARLVEACRASVGSSPGAIVGIAPHSLRAVTPDGLGAILPIAQGGPVHIHVAEQTAEVDACLAWSGRRPVEWLLANAPVDERWCLVHATHVTDAEVSGIAHTGAVVGLCPITEANLGDGLFPAARLAAAGGRYGIGSDSNVRIDPWEELRLLEYGQRLFSRSRNVMAAAQASTGRALYDAASAGGAQALGVPGGLVVGASADLVVLDPDHDLLVGRSDDAVLDTLVFGGAREAIRQVWCRGVLQVENGWHRLREALASKYRAALATLLRE